MRLYLLSTIITFVLFTNCKPEKKTNQSLNSISDCYPNNERPVQAITYQEMADMFKSYDKGQKKVLDNYISSKTKGKDSVATISQFFSISELKQYIAYLEKLSQEKEIALTGIRIFTAAYPENYKIKEYQNRISFILAPTTNIGNKKDVAYEPLFSENRKPVSMQSILNKYASETTKKVDRASIFSLSLRQDDRSSALNRGSLVPPYHQ